MRSGYMMMGRDSVAGEGRTEDPLVELRFLYFVKERLLSASKGTCIYSMPPD
jgi:hypothetical protein